MDLDDLPDVAIHECIHYLQEKHDKKGRIIRLGLCDYTDKTLPGVGLNEAAVQLMAAKASGEPCENVKYFDINLKTNTPMYYPLECALVSQMAYIVGEDVLFDSTLHSNSNFEAQYISLTSEEQFFKIQRNIELLIESQSKLENIYSSFEDVCLEENFVQKILKEIEETKTRVKKIFVVTQRLILTSYFDNAIQLVFAPKAIENYRNKLYLFKNLVCYTENDNFYTEYYRTKMEELEEKYEYKPSDVVTPLDLVLYKEGFFTKLFGKLKLLFRFNRGYERIQG